MTRFTGSQTTRLILQTTAVQISLHDEFLQVSMLVLQLLVLHAVSLLLYLHRENISKSPGTSVEVDGADSSKQEMDDIEGKQREAFTTQSRSEVCKDANGVYFLVKYVKAEQCDCTCGN